MSNYQPPRATYSAREAAALLGVATRTVYQLANSGAIPHVRLGRRTLIPVDAFNEWLVTQTRGGNA